jgi:hypothetical protein
MAVTPKSTTPENLANGDMRNRLPDPIDAFELLNLDRLYINIAHRSVNLR